MKKYAIEVEVEHIFKSNETVQIFLEAEGLEDVDRLTGLNAHYNEEEVLAVCRDKFDIWAFDATIRHEETGLVQSRHLGVVGEDYNPPYRCDKTVDMFTGEVG